ncbi:MAG: monovalent cation/H+ antiporter subunit D family protein, partial [Deltaproteobacteria bacterium]|nr:monovalent cation/H+ antiporter subunit D family protein [Deltaproteobacteria bacterium]
MDTVVSIRPLLAVLSSVVAVILICLCTKRPNLREFWSFGAGVVKFLLVISLTPLILKGKTVEYTVFTLLPG